MEASFHLTRALELLMTRSETLERSQNELELRVELGPVLMVTHGYASLELRDNYARARELCQQLMDTPKLFQVLKGLRRYYTNRGELQLAMEICWELLGCAEGMQETSYRDEAHLVVGVNAFWLGEFPDAYTHLEEAATFRRSVQHQWQLSRDPASNDMLTLASLTWVLLWALGYPDQALHKGYESLQHATELSHPYMLAHGRYWTALLHQLRGEWCAMQELAESCVTLAKEQGFATYRAYATMECGAAHAALGHGDEGIVQLKKAVCNGFC